MRMIAFWLYRLPLRLVTLFMGNFYIPLEGTGRVGLMTAAADSVNALDVPVYAAVI